MAFSAIFCHWCYNPFMATQTTMNISLPDSMRQWVEQRVESEGFGTASEYIRALVREDQKRRASEEIDQKLLAALDSGPAAEMTSSDWNLIKPKVRERLSAKKAKK
jgi:antitoxin ParD1/3/4